MRELADKCADLTSIEHRGICELQVLVRSVMNKSYLSRPVVGTEILRVA